LFGKTPGPRTLIVDQQYRWKSVLLPDPAPRVLDPLLIGELKQGRGRKFYLIYQFDLTEAEQYLADEFATKQNGPFAYPPTAVKLTSLPPKKKRFHQLEKKTAVLTSSRTGLVPV
jgi:hypothetical protein